MTYRPLRLTICLITLWLLLSGAAAQTVRIGAVVSRSGSAAGVGRAQSTALDVIETQMRFDSGLSGLAMDITVVDDGSSAATAVREATRLIEDEEVHALLCCSTESASRAVAGVAERSEVLMLNLSTTEVRADGEEPPYWVFDVAPSEVTLIRSMVLDTASKGGQAIALMALDNSYGDRAKNALELLLGPGGPRLVAEERYPASASVLTPEALWVATRQPDGVIVWGLERDSAVAYRGLRERGYDGPVYINPRMLGPLGGGPDLSRFEGALLPVSPVDMDRLPAGHPTASETRRYQSYTARFRLGSSARYGAHAWDAILLTRAAMAMTLTYGLEFDRLGVIRQALRDSLVGMDPMNGAGAVYDYSEDNHHGVLPNSLVIAEARNGGLELTR